MTRTSPQQETVLVLESLQKSLREVPPPENLFRPKIIVSEKTTCGTPLKDIFFIFFRRNWALTPVPISCGIEKSRPVFRGLS